MTHVKTISTHTISCSGCGCSVTVAWNVGRATCDFCRGEQEQAKRERRRAKRGRTDKPPTVKIISDPDNENGFRPGAAFLLEEHEANLRFGVYTPGTKVIVCGMPVIVAGDTGHKQREMRLR